MGNIQTVTDQLMTHFTTATHNTSWQVVYGHVCLMQDLPALLLTQTCAGSFRRSPSFPASRTW